MAEDYYQILGIERSASADEIKKAFRKKAHQYHPDKGGGDEAKFKQVSQAYQVLSNAQKRQQYDQFGTKGPSGQGFGSQAGGFGGFGDTPGGAGSGFAGNVDFGDLGDMFGDLFGFGSGRRRAAQADRGQDIQAELTIPFRVAAFGGSETIELQHHVACDRCNGQGAEPGTETVTCSTCQGAGQVQQTQRTFLGAIQSLQICPTCRGEGKTVKTPCKQCNGQGRESIKEKITVKIPAGVDTGQRIRITGKGEAGLRGTPAGDLYFVVSVQSDPDFKRTGADLLSNVEVPLSVASLGGAVSIKTLQGTATLKIPSGTKSGTEFKLKNKGLPNVRGNGTGDHRVTAHVTIPKKLSSKQKKLLQELQDEGL